MTFLFTPTCSALVFHLQYHTLPCLSCVPSPVKEHLAQWVDPEKPLLLGIIRNVSSAV